jgi:hypothetical protein
MVRWGATADGVLTARNMEDIYDVQEDLTVVAERAARSADVTSEVLDSLLGMMEVTGQAPECYYVRRPNVPLELE